MNYKALACILPCAFAVFAGAASAADYPSRPVTMIVPFGAGSTTDNSARVLAQAMSLELGQPIVVENKVGASGTIAAGAVAKSKADGYTLLYTTTSVQAISPHTIPGLSWDPLKSFSPVLLVSKLPQVLIVNEDLPIKNLTELIAYAKAHPGALNYASQGQATTQSLIMSLLNRRAGLSMTHVPYSNAASLYPDFLSGRIQVMFDNIPNAIPYVKEGKIRAIAVTSSERLPSLPGVPTVSEQGFVGFEVTAWTAIVAPEGTPPEVISKLAEAGARALDNPKVDGWLAANGAQNGRAVKSDVLAAFLAKELALWKQAVSLHTPN